jgi:hypothetical protein
MNSVGESRHMPNRHCYAMTSAGQLGSNTPRASFSSTSFSFFPSFSLFFGLIIDDDYDDNDWSAFIF